ncbi:MAG: transcription antitermination factor NusB [Flavobacteriales bacterium]|nr:transcription antitermination factor NusB [Flavobacteriales bacterium]
MLSRRHLRVKVMQALFAYQRSEGAELAVGEKLLKQSLERIFDLYIHQLSLITEIHSFAARQIEDAKHKLMPSQDDLNPNLRFIENRVLVQLKNNPQLEKQISARKINWADQLELIRRIFASFKESEDYINYMNGPEPTYKDERRIVYRLFEDFLMDNEHLQSIFEEKSILWLNDFEQVNEMVVRTISEFKKDVEFGGPLALLYKDEEEDKQFVLDLFRKTATNSGEYQKMIEAKLENWDLDRIASTDILLMKMALCEFININSVPTKVTMNEYIEISKEYSTPKSKVFINGILDKLLADLKTEGKIKKIGKGLIGG